MWSKSLKRVVIIQKICLYLGSRGPKGVIGNGILIGGYLLMSYRVSGRSNGQRGIKEGRKDRGAMRDEGILGGSRETIGILIGGFLGND